MSHISEKTNYYEKAKENNTLPKPALFGDDPGGGIFAGKARPFVLAQAENNLWEGIRKDAILYFNGFGKYAPVPPTQVKAPLSVKENITKKSMFWKPSGEKDIEGFVCQLPTAHTLSSQIACINHLFPMIDDKEAATCFLKGINEHVLEALPVQIHEIENFVEFEVVGPGSYLNEERPGKELTRGANCTSVDAVMRGRTDKGDILFLIEWKYTEEYHGHKTQYNQERWQRYSSFFTKDNTPFLFSLNKKRKDFAFWEALFTEPFYQLMRQTLLGHRMAQDMRQIGCVETVEHIIVVPDANEGYREKSVPQYFKAKKVEEAWNKLVKRKAHFYTPAVLFQYMRTKLNDRQAWFDYLSQRYWEYSK